MLDKWSIEAAFKPVFEFYAGVLARDGARRKLITRLGHEAGEILDEFSPSVSRRSAPANTDWSHFWLRLKQPVPRSNVRWTRTGMKFDLTVHASKGLEAPIVFLVDSGSASVIDQHMPRLTPFRLQGEFRGSRAICGGRPPRSGTATPMGCLSI
jgi:ATP-dependent helicase/nuclease subunit A